MRNQIEACINTVNQVVLGKEHAVQLAMACVLARGHLMIEDLPGVGKNTLSQALAQVLGLTYQRTQFTLDMLPRDILGTSVFNSDVKQFIFQPGPVFTELLLADEINRAAPKTQSALLSAMDERQIITEGVARPLSESFFVIATQNPLSQGATSSLSETQLDRFLMRLSLGYPSAKVERKLLQGNSCQQALTELPPVLERADLLAAQQQVSKVGTPDELLDYVLRLVEATRTHAQLAFGLSPRGSLALVAAARAWAFLAGRDCVSIEDIQAVFPAVAGHRLQEQNSPSGVGSAAIIKSLLVNVPTA